MNQKIRQDGWVALYALAASALVMLFASMNSYLYPLNPWNDVNCFVTVGKGMLKGVVPYRDIMEQKGPLLYGLHALALWISPGNYHGIYLLETLTFAATLMGMYKTARLYDCKRAVWALVPCGLFFAFAESFRCGDSAEELVMPLMVWSLYDALRALHTGKPIPLKRYVLHGAMAGCILWIKFSVLGLHFAFMSFLAIHALIQDRNLKRPVCMCLCFLGGMALATLPWVIYFGVHHAIGDWLGVYIIDNLFSYRRVSRWPVTYAISLTLRGIRSDPVLAGALLLGGAFAMLSRKFAWREKGFILWAGVMVALMTYGGGVGHLYYFLTFAVFLPISLTAMSTCLDMLPFHRIGPGVTRGVCLGTLAACVLATALFHDSAPYILYPYEDTVQGQVKEVIGDEDVVLLNANCLDGGFYFAMDLDPPMNWFCRLNVRKEESYVAHTEFLKAGKADWVVTRGEIEDDQINEIYELVGYYTSDYGSKNLGIFDYRLYKRRDEA